MTGMCEAGLIVGFCRRGWSGGAPAIGWRRRAQRHGGVQPACRAPWPRRLRDRGGRHAPAGARHGATARAAWRWRTLPERAWSRRDATVRARRGVGLARGASAAAGRVAPAARGVEGVGARPQPRPSASRRRRAGSKGWALGFSRGRARRAGGARDRRAGRSASAEAGRVSPEARGIERVGARLQPRPSAHSSTPFCACRRFSASSNTTLCGPSITSSVISSPRWAGRQCITIASPAACFSSAAFNW